MLDLSRLDRSNVPRYRLFPQPDGPGPCCDERGAFVAGIPLLKRRSGGSTWEARPAEELNPELGKAYDAPIDVSQKLPAIERLARSLNEGDQALACILLVQMRFPEIPPLTKSAEDPALRAGLLALLWHGGLLKADWDADKHPRRGEPPNPGWFAPVDQGQSVASRSDAVRGVAPVPVVDFSGGFHDAVVDAWVKAFGDAGIPAVKAPAIRLIGPDNRVIGYPDIIIHWPGQPIEVYEVKTGSDPPLTFNQRVYIPLLQYGGHIYSTDPRIRELGLEPRVPFPPARVNVLLAPGPNLPYKIVPQPPPETVP